MQGRMRERNSGAVAVEQRREGRVPAEVWIQTDDPMTNYIGSTADVSPGGMYVHCPDPLPVGAHCRVSVTIHGATAECEAWVARSLPTGRRGMGVVFQQPDLFFSAAVNALVEACRRPAWDLRTACTVRLGMAA
jgi:hypothetical protein